MVQKARDEKADTSGTVARTLAVLTVMKWVGFTLLTYFSI
jgi:hypothetical protein